MKKSYSINIPTDLFWKVIVPSLVLVAIVGGGLGIVIIDKMIMPGIVHTGRQIVDVPQVTGKDWEVARQDLFNVGLRLQISEKKYQETLPDGFIINQVPAAGEKVKKGRMVIVSVSKGSEVGVVPVVRGLTERKATTELRKGGFIIGKRKHDYNDTLVKDNVVSISPAAGTKVSREMPLDIVISDGPKPTHATVPNLVGETLVEAKQKIEESGLVLGTLANKNNTAVVPGTVLSQSVPPGSSLPLQSKINIIVSVAK